MARNKVKPVNTHLADENSNESLDSAIVSAAKFLVASDATLKKYKITRASSSSSLHGDGVMSQDNINDESIPSRRDQRRSFGRQESFSRPTRHGSFSKPLTKAGSFSKPISRAGSFSKPISRAGSFSSNLSRGDSVSKIEDTPTNSSKVSQGMHRENSMRVDGYSTPLYSLSDKLKKLEESLVERRKDMIRKNRGRTMSNIRDWNGSSGFKGSATMSGPTILTKSIVLGGRDDAKEAETLANIGVTHVLNVAKQLPNYHESSGTFIYCHIPLQDAENQDLTECLPLAASFISRAESVGGRVFVHCISGVSRSVAIIVMYLIKEHHFELRKAHQYIKHCRPFISPNEGFKLQMVRLEVKELGYSSVIDKRAGADWNFYGLNSIKTTLPSPPEDSQRRGRRRGGGDDLLDCCCVIA